MSQGVVHAVSVGWHVTHQESCGASFSGSPGVVGVDTPNEGFFRAVNACPWSKALWLDGLRALHGVLPPGEMGELLEVMTEKGLRLRTDIFEALLEDAGGVEGVPMCE